MSFQQQRPPVVGGPQGAGRPAQPYGNQPSTAANYASSGVMGQQHMAPSTMYTNVSSSRGPSGSTPPGSSSAPMHGTSGTPLHGNPGPLQTSLGAAPTATTPPVAFSQFQKPVSPRTTSPIPPSVLAGGHAPSGVASWRTSGPNATNVHTTMKPAIPSSVSRGVAPPPAASSAPGLTSGAYSSQPSGTSYSPAPPRGSPQLSSGPFVSSGLGHMSSMPPQTLHRGMGTNPQMQGPSNSSGPYQSSSGFTSTHGGPPGQRPAPGPPTGMSHMSAPPPPSASGSGRPMSHGPPSGGYLHSSGSQSRPPYPPAPIGGPPLAGQPLSQAQVYQQPPPGKAAGTYAPPGAPAMNGGPRGPPSSSPRQRIDPSQIPRPPVPEEHVNYVSKGRTRTNPPLASSEFTAVDEGNCNPRFMRPTVNHIPSCKEMANDCRIPFAVLLRPMATLPYDEPPVPLVDFSAGQGGAKFQCNICQLTNEVPREYQCNTDEYGRRRDADIRPELSKGTVDMLVSSEYSVRPPQEPIYVFVIDTTVQAVNSGMVQIICDTLCESLDDLQGGARAKVAIVAVDQQIRYFDMSPSCPTTRAAVVVDIDDPFAPLPPPSWLVPMNDEGKAKVRELLDQLPDMVEKTIAANAVTGSALASVVEGLKGIGGRVLVFQSCLPRAGLGTLKNRETARFYGSSGERLMYSADPQDEFYSNLLKDCVKNQIGVDFFYCGPTYLDMATSSQTASGTGGSIYYYPGMVDDSRDLPEMQRKLSEELRHNLTRNVAFEAVLKVRCSAGMEVQEYLGHCSNWRGQEVDMAVLDADKTLGVSFSYDGELQEGGDFFIQAALLHTNSKGHRVVRVINLALPVATLLANVFRYSDLEAICCFLQKQATMLAMKKDLNLVRDEIVHRIVEILYSYRKNCASASSSGQLILPESLKLLPLYALGALKSLAFVRNDAGAASSSMVQVRADERVYHLYMLLGMGPREFVKLVYPVFMSLLDMDEKCGVATADSPYSMVKLPDRLGPSAEYLNEQGVFLLDNGIHMWMFVGSKVEPSYLMDLFGEERVDSAEKAISLLEGPQASELSARVGRIIARLRGRLTALQLSPEASGDQSSETERWHSSLSPALSIITQSDWRSTRFMNLLMEDRSKNDVSYVEFLVLVHKKIQTKLS